MPDQPSLAIVIPVFNEQENLVPLLSDWKPVFASTGASCRILLIDDGSKDGSLALLRSLGQQDRAMEIYSQSNAGHGASILRGYRMALDADWVFQIDSDHQLDPAAFMELWNNREAYDLLIAQRVEKNASPARRRLSRVSQAIVFCLFGSAIRDINSPFRLIRTEPLGAALGKIPPRSFAPNILITAWFISQKSSIFTTVVMPRGGTGLRRSKMSGLIWRGAIRSAVQTLLFRLRC